MVIFSSFLFPLNQPFLTQIVNQKYNKELSNVSSSRVIICFNLISLRFDVRADAGMHLMLELWLIAVKLVP